MHDAPRDTGEDNMSDRLRELWDNGLVRFVTLAAALGAAPAWLLSMAAASVRG